MSITSIGVLVFAFLLGSISFSRFWEYKESEKEDEERVKKK